MRVPGSVSLGDLLPREALEALREDKRADEIGSRCVASVLYGIILCTAFGRSVSSLLILAMGFNGTFLGFPTRVHLCSFERWVLAIFENIVLSREQPSGWIPLSIATERPVHCCVSGEELPVRIKSVNCGPANN